MDDLEKGLQPADPSQRHKETETTPRGLAGGLEATETTQTSAQPNNKENLQIQFGNEKVALS